MFAIAATAQVNIHIDLQNTKTFDSIFVKSEAKLQTKKYLSAPFGSSANLAMTVGFPELRRQCGVSHEV